MEGVAARPLGPAELSSQRRLPRVRYWLGLMDGLAAVVSLMVLCVGVVSQDFSNERMLLANLISPALVLLLTLVLNLSAGQYSDSRRLSRLRDVGALTRSLIIAAAIAALLSFLTKGFFTGFTSPSRLLTGATLVIFFLLGFVSRGALAAYQRRLFVRGETVRNILVVGSGDAAKRFLEFLDKRPWLGVRCVGRLAYAAPGNRTTDDAGVADGKDLARSNDSDAPGDKGDIWLTSSVEGLEELHRALMDRGADEVVVALDAGEAGSLPEITRLLSIAHVPFRLVPTLFEQSYRATELLGYAELPVIDVNVDPMDRVQRIVKRVLDVTAACVFMIPGLPLAAFLAAAIKLDSRGPVFYRQERVGKNGRRFGILKFRTMVTDADKMLARLRDQDESGSSGRMFKIKSDPRVTRVGSFLRKWSLDELPQVVNVLRGEMSFVGPRPPLPHEVDNYQEEHLYRLRGLPGITGLWQVSGRSDLDFEQMVKLDRYYLENWSIGMDLGILAKTVLVVFARKGAY